MLHEGVRLNREICENGTATTLELKYSSHKGNRINDKNFILEKN